MSDFWKPKWTSFSKNDWFLEEESLKHKSQTLYWINFTPWFSIRNAEKVKDEEKGGNKDKDKDKHKDKHKNKNKDTDKPMIKRDEGHQ